MIAECKVTKRYFCQLKRLCVVLLYFIDTTVLSGYVRLKDNIWLIDMIVLVDLNMVSPKPLPLFYLFEKPILSQIFVDYYSYNL